MTLPPDPDNMNGQRSEAAQAALDAFLEAMPTDDADAVCDLLCDLKHLLDRRPDLGRWGAELARALAHYDAETEAT